MVNGVNIIVPNPFNPRAVACPCGWHHWNVFVYPVKGSSISKVVGIACARCKKGIRLDDNALLQGMGKEGVPGKTLEMPESMAQEEKEEVEDGR